MKSTLSRLSAALLAGLCLAVATAPAADAHPLGNFTVNHYTGLVLRPDRIDAVVVIDRAEIAAAQEVADIDTNRDGAIDPSESTAHARGECGTLAPQLRVTVEDDPAPARWKLSASALSRPPGEAGLKTSRLQCTLSTTADLRAPADVEVRTAYDTRRVGWQEVTARGDGIALTASNVPARSATNELRHYPEDPLTSPLNQRSATLRVQPGVGETASATNRVLDGTGPLGAVLNKVADTFTSLVGSRELTLPVGLLAILLALVLGASHAAMPGHGKTIMAAYLAGRRGTPRDAITVGATVTFTHTAGVLVLGLVLPLATHLAGETVLTWLGIASGLLVTSIGLWLLRSALRNQNTHHHHHHGHGHGHGHDDHGHARHEPPPPAVPSSRTARPELNHEGSVALLTKEHGHPHAHPHSHTHHHDAPKGTTKPTRTTRVGLIGMGIAGGLVPSPSALVVLLGAIALGRTAFGILLVIAYGLGMAGTLTLAGLLLVRLRDRIEAGLRTATTTRWTHVRRLARYGPVGTSTLVLIVGIGLTARAAIGPL